MVLVIIDLLYPVLTGDPKWFIMVESGGRKICFSENTKQHWEKRNELLFRQKLLSTLPNRSLSSEKGLKRAFMDTNLVRGSHRLGNTLMRRFLIKKHGACEDLYFHIRLLYPLISKAESLFHPF